MNSLAYRKALYKWKKAYELEGMKGLEKKKPIAYNIPNHIKPDTIQKVLGLCEEY